MDLTERAPAKVNLTLRVLGRRSDGYHELDSLAVFAADVADMLTLDPGLSPGLSVAGSTAHQIAGGNIVERVLALSRCRLEAPKSGHIHIEKVLPVAAGIGGGSANAAAALRLLQRLNPKAAPRVWDEMAASLGADVSVCLRSSAQRMRGVGDRLAPIKLPDVFGVLVNPMVDVPSDKTPQVFRALAAKPVPASGDEDWPHILSFDDLAGFVRRYQNDLEPAAAAVVPAVARVMEVLRALPSAGAAVLSGAGPTGVALFGSRAEADCAAASIARAYPAWWVAPSRLV